MAAVRCQTPRRRRRAHQQRRHLRIEAFLESSVEDLERFFDTNVKGTWLMSHAIVPARAGFVTDTTLDVDGGYAHGR